MRALVVATTLAVALAACAGRAPQHAHKPVSYNRRELPPAPGLLTGPDGTWTIYRNDRDEAPPAPEAAAPQPERPKHREILMCDRSRNCEQPEDAK